MNFTQFQKEERSRYLEEIGCCSDKEKCEVCKKDLKFIRVHDKRLIQTIKQWAEKKQEHDIKVMTLGTEREVLNAYARKTVLSDLLNFLGK